VTEESIVAIGQGAMMMMIMLGGPFLIITLVVGLLVSIFQAVTQINEMTLTFVPKVIALFVTLIVLGPWMLTTLQTYTADLIVQMATFAR
jgi:flagellar biosynthesis protein FliQ